MHVQENVFNFVMINKTMAKKQKRDLILVPEHSRNIQNLGNYKQIVLRKYNVKNHILNKYTKRERQL